jgi:hypothetical protein
MNLKAASLFLASMFVIGCGTQNLSTTNASRNYNGLSKTTGVKRALLVGINKYQMPGNNLSGCVNDIVDVQNTILNDQGFETSNITTITDKAATREAILSGLKKLVAAGQPGDFLYFHYSGHGAQVNDTNGDEPDGQDEILCPTDLAYGNGGFKNAIVDDEIQSILGQLKPGVGFFMISDSCHSGSVDRTMKPGQKSRQIILPKNAVNQTPMVYNAQSATTFKNREAAGKYVLISGCEDDQTSADAYINNRYNGACTYYYLDAYKKGGKSMTYGQLHTAMVEGLTAGQYEQRPVITGNGQAKIFSIPS